MTSPPRVVLVLDPRPGAVGADEIVLPDGRRLDEVVGERAVVETGRLAGTVRGGHGVAELLESADSSAALCLVDAAALAFPTTYGDVVADPRPESAVLTDDGSSRAIAVRLEPAVLQDADVVERAARSLRVAPAGLALSVLSGELRSRRADVRVVGSGTFPVHAVWSSADLPAALGREAGADESALRLRRASRADDGFLSTFLVRPLSRRFTRVAVTRGLRPNVITAVSCALGLLAAGAYAGGGAAWRIAGSLLLLTSLVVDCVDGEVARYTRTFSPLGGWLDVGSDRLKEYAVYAGLAWGSSPHAWGLATACFAVLVVRHFVDFGYAATVSAGVRGGRVETLSDRTSSRPALMWAKRTVVLPVGERTIALAVLVPIVGARRSLIVLLVLGCVAGVYTLVGRLGRTLAGATTRRQRLGWLSPAAQRAVEQGGLALLVGLLRPGALSAAYLVLAAVALHQYDLVYRSRLTGAVSPGTGPLERIPWWLRVAAVAVLAVLLPEDILRSVLLALGVFLGLAAVADSVAWWRSFVRSGL